MACPAAAPPTLASDASRAPDRGGWAPCPTRPVPPPRRPPPSSTASTPTGAPRTTSPSARSTCSTTRCCASRCASSTSSRACSATGARRPASTSSTRTSTASSARDDLTCSSSPGPGHGGPGLVANTYLEGTYTEVYPDVARDEDGLRRLFRQFSFPGGIPSHVAPETPGSIHEGGELGYALVHAYGAAFDNPDLLVCCVVGDGEAETGPARRELALEQVPQPGARRRRAADPAPQRLQDRQPDGARAASPTTSCARCSRATATSRCFVDGRRPGRGAPAHGRDARPASLDEIAAIQRARARRARRAPALADDRPAHAEGLDRARRRSTACRSRARSARTRCRCRAARQPRAPRAARGVDALLPARGAVRRARRAARPSSRRSAPEGERRMGANPHANGGAAAARPASCPTSATTPSTCRRAGATTSARRRACSAAGCATSCAPTPTANFRLFGPDETASNRLGAVFEATDRAWMAERSRRRRPPRARRPRHGGAQRAPLPGLARGLPADRPPRPLQLLRGVHPHRRLDVQPARQVAEGHARRSRGGGRSPR